MPSQKKPKNKQSKEMLFASLLLQKAIKEIKAKFVK